MVNINTRINRNRNDKKKILRKFFFWQMKLNTQHNQDLLENGVSP